MELYNKLIAGRRGLKASVTRQINQLNNFVNGDSLNQTAFEDKRLSLKSAFDNLRKNLKLLSNAQLELTNEKFDEAIKDLDEKETIAADIKCEFDKLFLSHTKSSELDKKKCNVDEPRFKPRDLCLLKWDGDIITFNSWKCCIKDYFYLTGLTQDREQLVVLLNDNIFPSAIQSTLLNCLSAREVWESLEARFPSESIPETIMHTLKGVKPMTSCSAKEL